MKKLGSIVMGLVVLGVFGLVITFIFARGIYVSEARAVKTLETNGFTDIEIVNKDVFFISWRGCGDSDVAAFDAKAINPNGRLVDISTCHGFLKGGTVRVK